MKRFVGFLIIFGLLLLLAAPVIAQDTPTPEPVGAATGCADLRSTWPLLGAVRAIL